MLHQNHYLDTNIIANNEILAADIYTVFIPDLFWKGLPGCELNSINDIDINKTIDLIRTCDLDKGFEYISIC